VCFALLLQLMREAGSPHTPGVCCALSPQTSIGGTLALNMSVTCISEHLGPRLGDPGYDRPFFTSLGPPRAGPGVVYCGSLVSAS
jgi:hypothetical protein